MALDFIKFGNDGDQFLKTLAKELGYPKDKERAGRVLQAILHAIRNHLTIEESVQLISQLPMFLKAVYVNSWNLNRTRGKLKTMKDFKLDVWQEDADISLYDFPEDDDAVIAFGVVLSLLKKYISPGEIEDIRAQLPKKLKILLDTSKKHQVK